MKEAKHLDRCWSSLGFLTVSAQASHLKACQKATGRMDNGLTGKKPWLFVNIVEFRCYKTNTKVLTDKYRQQKEMHKIFWKNLRSGDRSGDIIILQLTYVLRVSIFNHLSNEALTLYAMIIATISIYHYYKGQKGQKAVCNCSTAEYSDILYTLSNLML